MSKNRIRLEICGVECVIASDDSEEYIRAIGAEVARSMNAMCRQNERISIATAAVFAALNYCDDAQKAKAAADNLRAQIKNYVEDASHARMEADEARREADRLSREVQRLRARLAEEEADEPKPESSSHQDPKEERPAPAEASQPQENTPEGVDPDAEKGFISFFEKKTDEE